MEQRLVKKVLKIEGMTCTSCEMRIEKTLRKLDGVLDVKVSFAGSNVCITYDMELVGLDKIIEQIESIGYIVKDQAGISKTQEDKKNLNSTDKISINQLLGILIIVFALYMITKNTVGFNFIPQVNQSMSYGILFIVGLLTSLHCIAMCGGINLSQCISNKVDEGITRFDKLRPSLLYNSGRVVSYTVIGGVVGTLGAVVSFSGTAKGIVAIISGIFMVIMGLNMLNVFPWLRKLGPRMPKVFGSKIFNNNGKHGPFYVGLLNGFMPCGPLQAMQLYALGTGSFIAGAASMFMFSLGTVPLMFGLGAFSTLLSRKFTHKMLKVSAVLVMVLGVIMLNRGLSLSGISVAQAASPSKISSTSGNAAKIDGSVQVVTTKLEGGRYTPIVVQKGIPVRWTIKANQADLNGCNNPVTIPKYNIQKQLVPGDNVIEFTPQEEGNVVYTCWMGMISSNITVVADLTKVKANGISQAGSVDQANSGVGAGGCCSAGSKATEFAGGRIPTDQIAVAEIKNGVQYVSINVNDYGFSPAVIVMQKDIETRWIINGEQLNSCNSTLIFPDYNERLTLKAGQNQIKFTPKADFSFSCWMGMLNGYVKVVDDISKVKIEDIKKEVETAKPGQVGRGGCCGR